MNTSSKLLAAIIGLQVLSLAGQFLGQPTLVAPAQAQIPDAGGQRVQMIEELRAVRAELKTANASLALLTGKVDKVSSNLESGNLQVRVVSPDEHKRPATR